MNTHEAINELCNGYKITHKNWDRSIFIQLRGNCIYDNYDNNIEETFGVGDFIKLINGEPNDGWSIWFLPKPKKKIVLKSAKNVKVGDIIRDNEYKFKYKVKFVDDECIVITSNKKGSTVPEAFDPFQWEEDYHKDYRLVVEKE